MWSAIDKGTNRRSQGLLARIRSKTVKEGPGRRGILESTNPRATDATRLNSIRFSNDGASFKRCYFESVLRVFVSLLWRAIPFELVDHPLQYWNVVWNYVIFLPAIYVLRNCSHRFANFKVFWKVSSGTGDCWHLAVWCSIFLVYIHKIVTSDTIYLCL